MSLNSDILWLAVPLLVALTLACVRSSVRRAYADGWRCLKRFPRIAGLPVFFSVCHILFVEGIAAYQRGWQWPVNELSEDVISLPPSPVENTLAAIVPTIETLSSMLSCLVTTFPVSSLFALAFLLNWHGYSAVLIRTVWRRFRWGGVVLILALALAAVAAAAKPASVLFLPLLEERLEASNLYLGLSAMNAAAFVFEYLVGVCFQVYLMTMAFTWLRGMNQDRSRLMKFAVRRSVFVLKWAAVVIAATLLGIHLPMIMLWFFPGDSWPAALLENAVGLTGTTLPLAMLVFAPMQIILTFHNDSLREALTSHWRFIHRNLVPLSLFLASALFGFVTVWTGFEVSKTALNPNLEIAVILARSIFMAASGGWILASWVCFYKSLENGSRTIAF